MTSEQTSLDQLREQADQALKQLSGRYAQDALAGAKPLVESLRNVREYPLMGRLAEAISRLDPRDAKNRRLYAQYLIECGRASVAIDVLGALLRRMPLDHEERSEVMGLLGRANKQIFFEAGDKANAGVQKALKEAIDAYRKAFEESSRNTWHGVNLLALIGHCRSMGLRISRDWDQAAIAQKVIAALNAIPETQRDEWFHPTLAEAYLALSEWDRVEEYINAYAGVQSAQAFQLESTLRQFTQIWNLEEAGERGRGLVNILRARLLQLPGGQVQVDAGDIQRLLKQSAPPAGQLEAVLGVEGPQTYRWWKMGLQRALSIVSIRRKLGNRRGTGWLVRGRDIGIEPADEVFVITNFHVINENGVSPGIRPDNAEIVFEAFEPPRTVAIQNIVWSSPLAECDACVLRLSERIDAAPPLSVSSDLPKLGEQPRVYLIGYPGGGELSFSFQDNELLDHEGPPNGHPPIPGICRVHYRAPTEAGSSGSPVFEASSWQVIALHHKGGQAGMPKLNGLEGTYAANEGISIGSIVRAAN